MSASSFTESAYKVVGVKYKISKIARRKLKVKLIIS